MKTTKRILMLLIIASMTTILGCAKDGKDGKDGLPGPAGQDGNANVESSTFYNRSWVYSSSENAYIVSLWTSNITQDVVLNGSVHCYISYDSGSSYLTLPLSLQSVSMLYGYELNSLDIIAYGYSSTPNPITVKIVTIPSSAKLANPNVDYSNYEEVKRVFKLEE